VEAEGGAAVTSWPSFTMEKGRWAQGQRQGPVQGPTRVLLSSRTPWEGVLFAMNIAPGPALPTPKLGALTFTGAPRPGYAQ